jgi:16S rRNA (cytosine1402-N4)-methyltransferase
LSVLHTPVMAGAVLEWLRVRPDGTYLDATVGTGGHALGIAQRLGKAGRLIGLDRDPQALEIARERLKGLEGQVTLVQTDFSKIGEVVSELKLGKLHGVVADLGVSSLELDTPERGFSFRWGGPLDMRMNPQHPFVAEEIVNHWSEKELADVLYKFGEEHDSRRIARAIVRARPVRDTEHLATIVAGVHRARGRQRLHPATKTFLALRIAVNRELEELAQFLDRTPATLSPEARWAILSYHSLEDRMVKRGFQELARTGEFQILTKKTVQADEAEVQANPRARSAKLRVIERRAAAEANEIEAVDERRAS